VEAVNIPPSYCSGRQQTTDYDVSKRGIDSPSSQHRQYHLPEHDAPCGPRKELQTNEDTIPGTIYTSVPIPVGVELEKLLLDTW